MDGCKQKMGCFEGFLERGVNCMQYVDEANDSTRAGSESTSAGLPACGRPVVSGRTVSVCSMLAVGLLLSCLMAYSAVAGAPGPGNMPPPLVGLERVVLQDVNPPAAYVGHVEAIQSVDLRARVEGFLEQVNFKEGDYVRAGKVLYAIEQAPYRAKVASDKAQVEEAEAELARSAQYLGRLRSARPGSIPATDLDNAVAAQLRAKAQIDQAKAALTRSQLDLDYTTIQAPISGRIGKTAYTRGNLVGPSSMPLARIVQVDPIRVVYSISENDLASIQAALKDMAKGRQSPVLAPRLRLADGTVLDIKGRVDFVDNEVDSATGTIAVRTEFDNPDGVLIPGQYVNVLVSLAEPRMMPVVPQAAVQQDHEGSYVLVVNGENRVDIRRVKMGAVVGAMWAVESGLNEGERVIVQGVQKVQPGMTVRTGVADNGQGR